MVCYSLKLILPVFPNLDSRSSYLYTLQCYREDCKILLSRLQQLVGIKGTSDREEFLFTYIGGLFLILLVGASMVQSGATGILRLHTAFGVCFVDEIQVYLLIILESINFLQLFLNILSDLKT